MSINVIAIVPSDSNPSKFYEIRKGADNNTYCTCPAWKFQKVTPAKRTCKHLKRLAANMSQHANRE